MASRRAPALLLLSCALAPLALAVALPATLAHRHCFPSGFLFGAGVADGVHNSICDGLEGPESVVDALLRRYKRDVATLASMGLQSFRLSVSWARVMTWDASSSRMQPNERGLELYRAVLDELKARDIAPIVAILHDSLPLALQTHVGGWKQPEMADHFAQYASLLFREFGDKVAFWATINDPLSIATVASASNSNATISQDKSNSSTSGRDDIYIIAHNLLMAHARAVQIFRALQLGVSASLQRAPINPRARIGMPLGSTYYYPLNSKSSTDSAAAARALAFDFGWFLDPLVSGDYPAVMKQRIGKRLPEFTAEQRRMVKGSYDILMLTHFQSRAVTDCGSACAGNQWAADRAVNDTEAMPSSAPLNSSCSHLTPYAPGYLAHIKWMHAKDSHAPLLLTGNGWCGDASAVSGGQQLEFFRQSVLEVHAAVTDARVPVVGYIAWSLVSSYRGGSGFGLFDAGGQSPSVQVARPAAPWLGRLAATKCLPLVEVAASERRDGGDAGDGDPSNWLLVCAGVALVLALGSLYVALAGRAIAQWRTSRAPATPDELTPLLS